MNQTTPTSPQISNWKIFLQILSQLKTVRKSFWWLGILLLIYVACTVVEPYFYKLFVDEIQKIASANSTLIQSYPYLIKVSLAWIFLVWVTIIVFYIFETQTNMRANKDWERFALEMYQHILHLPVDYHISNNIGERLKIYDRGVGSVWEIGYDFFIDVIPTVLILISLLVFGFIIDPWMTLACLWILPIGILISITIGAKAHTLQREVNKLWDHIFSRFWDGFTNLSIIRLYAREKQETRIMTDAIHIWSVKHLWVRKFWAVLRTWEKVFELVGKMIVIITGTFFILNWRIGIGDLFFFVTLASRIYSPLQGLEVSYRNIIRYIADFDKIRLLLYRETEKDLGKTIFAWVKNSLTYNHLSFSYPSNDREILKNISFEIQKGQKVAFVGHTGSWKTTLTQLLTRFYEPISGSIEIDGTDIRDFTLESYRSRLAAVFQDTTLFNDTIRHNLEYVRDNVTFEQIREACRQANILEFIEGLEKGFDTEVGERGLKLSGGEKQRLAIARAIIANPEILILDEATSALDAKTERLVQEAFNTLMEGRTSIIIAHRLSTIRHADRIFLFEKGELIGSGLHDELYISSPVYREMVDYQKNGFVNE